MAPRSGSGLDSAIGGGGRIGGERRRQRAGEIGLPVRPQVQAFAIALRLGVQLQVDAPQRLARIQAGNFGGQGVALAIGLAGDFTVAASGAQTT